MLVAPVGFVARPRRIALAGVTVIIAVLASAAPAAAHTAAPAAAHTAAPMGLLSLAKLDRTHEIERSRPMTEATAELRRKSAKRARVSAAVRAFRARVARLKARYKRMARVRARIPEKVRRARAQGELARLQRKGAVHCLATAIYHEARYESARGQRAVAEVIIARSKTPGRPKTICGVVWEGAWRATGCQFSFACDGLSDGANDKKQWARARRVAAEALARKGKKNHVARGATFYHATYVKPRWAKSMRRVARIGTHVFYRPR